MNKPLLDMRPEVCRLDRLAKGQSGLVCAVDDSHLHARALRRMGLRVGARIEVLSAADPVLIRCEGSCLAIGRCMLQGISILDSQTPDLCQNCPEHAAATMLRAAPAASVAPVEPADNVRRVRPVRRSSPLGKLFSRLKAGLTGILPARN